MKFLSYWKDKKSEKSFYIKNNDTRYVNWSEGHLYKNNFWFSREKYLRHVANFIKDGHPIIRDGTKITHLNTFQKLFSGKPRQRSSPPYNFDIIYNKKE